ncbi:hypothetical protein JCM11251_000110 [Rhodosporidiobolus azoricus]
MNSPPLPPSSAYMSPYASMSIPAYCMLDVDEAATIARREYNSLAQSHSWGLVAKAREADRAYMTQAKEDLLFRLSQPGT